MNGAGSKLLKSCRVSRNFNSMSTVSPSLRYAEASDVRKSDMAAV